MAGFVYVLAEPGDAYAPSVLADDSLHGYVDIFEAPTAIAILHLARGRRYDLVSGFPVLMYPHNRDIRVCILYANGCGFLPGGCAYRSSACRLGNAGTVLRA